ncbi:hypothetical protein [Streptomyces sp. NPDC049881]|uniref:hypothetical protein n=1 Tax=Streptomyces sp. NPDC049881 TaxID=3155778 RepID=UPI0034397645
MGGGFRVGSATIEKLGLIPTVWAHVIASVRFPGDAEEGGIDKIPKECDVKLVEDLIDLLEDFIEEHVEMKCD